MSESRMAVWKNNLSNATAHALGDQTECKLCPDWLQNNGICRVHIALTAGDGTTPKITQNSLIFLFVTKLKYYFRLKFKFVF